MYKIPLISKDPSITGLPLEYDSAKGCEIKIGNKTYLDFSVIGASACILGYSNKYVNRQIIKCIKNGSFSSLNSRYMSKLTDLLLGMHPEIDIVRYCKGGGEALDLALQLAIEKVYLNKNFVKIYQIGYNGWIIKNSFRRTVGYQYSYHLDNINDIIFENHRPDIIIFELIRHEYPKSEVIRKLKEWQEQGTILIIDEVTTGFRFCCGGVYQLYGLNPNIVVYAKGISNGYPLACIIGKKEIMESDLWISSTYWSDSIGFVAGYYTIKKLKHCNYKLLIKLGKAVMKIWEVCAKKYDIKIKIGDVPNIANFEFDYDNKLELKSLFIQEMQKYGVLALDQYYPSFVHNAKSIGSYAKACRLTFETIKKYLTNELKDYNIKILKEINK